MARTSVRAIIQKEDGLVLIHRIKHKDGVKKEYYVFPGGGVEERENNEECIVREIKEELGIIIKLVKKLYESTFNDKTELFYLCEHIEGKIGTGTGPEFTSEEYSDRGLYIPKIIKFDELIKLNVQPTEIRDKIVRDLK